MTHTSLQAPRRSADQSEVPKKANAGLAVQRAAVEDRRPEAAAQRKLADMAANSPRVQQQRAQSERMQPGLPGQLKAGIESLSGMSMDHVRVHYNSSKPAQLQAHAYAQGSDIHVAPGQEAHLPHEAWHVVQQAQGRVKPTLPVAGMAVNDDAGLEAEADTMGARADMRGRGAGDAIQLASMAASHVPASASPGGEVVQRNVGFNAAALAAPFFRATNGNGVIVRPNWTGHWANPGVIAGLGAGNSRNHVVAYHHIAEALVNLANAIYVGLAGGGGAGGAVAALTGVSDALYPGAAGAEYAAMTANRTALVTAITNVANHAAPTLLEQNAMEQAATALEGDLMSAPQNVRAANANMNLRIGNNIDATYHLTALPAFGGGAGFLQGNTMPAAWLAAGGAQWGHVGLGGTALAPGAQFYVMDPVHNAMVDRFTAHGAAHLGVNVTVVRNDDPANMVPGYTANAPLSSTANPGGGGFAVLLFDPAGANLPIRFA
jgi:hypothetical protein